MFEKTTLGKASLPDCDQRRSRLSEAAANFERRGWSAVAVFLAAPCRVHDVGNASRNDGRLHLELIALAW
jgi:hypothetical protein